MIANVYMGNGDQTSTLKPGSLGFQDEVTHKHLIKLKQGREDAGGWNRKTKRDIMSPKEQKRTNMSQRKRKAKNEKKEKNEQNRAEMSQNK